MRKHIDPQTLSHAKMSYALKMKLCEENFRPQVPKDGNRFCQSDLAGVETPQQFPLNIKRIISQAKM